MDERALVRLRAGYQRLQCRSAVGVGCGQRRPDRAPAGYRRKSHRSEKRAESQDRPPSRHGYARAGAQLRPRKRDRPCPPRSLFFQIGYCSGGKIGHRQRAALVVMSEKLRHAAGYRPRGTLHPACLVEIASDGRAPIGRDPQLGQCALHTDRTARQVDPPNVGGNSAAERTA